jgi:hypothetical protein
MNTQTNLTEFDEILEKHEIPDENPGEPQDNYIRRKRREFLEEMVEHFSNNPRAMNNQGDCVYSRDINGGCAIGRKMSADLAKEFDLIGNGIGVRISDCQLFDRLPPELSVLGVDFLTECQDMHDYSDNWKSGGLSDYGQTNLNSIIREFC